MDSVISDKNVLVVSNIFLANITMKFYDENIFFVLKCSACLYLVCFLFF